MTLIAWEGIDDGIGIVLYATCPKCAKVAVKGALNTSEAWCTLCGFLMIGLDGRLRQP